MGSKGDESGGEEAGPQRASSDTYNEHNLTSPSQKYTFTARLFICSVIAMFALWLEMGCACYATAYHENEMNKRGQDSLRFSLQFYRLERV